MINMWDKYLKTSFPASWTYKLKISFLSWLSKLVIKVYKIIIFWTWIISIWVFRTQLIVNKKGFFGHTKKWFIQSIGFRLSALSNSAKSLKNIKNKKKWLFFILFFFKKHAIQLFMSNIFSKTRYNLPWVIVISIDCCKCPEAQWWENWTISIWWKYGYWISK